MNKLKQIILHAIIWIAIVLFFMYNNGRIEYSTIVIFVYFGVINISLFYINYLIILPTFLNRKKYLWVALSILFLVKTNKTKVKKLFYTFPRIKLFEGKWRLLNCTTYLIIVLKEPQSLGISWIWFIAKCPLPPL